MKRKTEKLIDKLLDRAVKEDSITRAICFQAVATLITAQKMKGGNNGCKNFIQ